MAVRNAHWYDRNETQAYPLDETADCTDAAGVYLPPDILADLNLRYPAAYGAYPFVAAVTVTPTLVTLAIQAADSLEAPTTLTPLAVLTARQPAAEGRLLALTPLLPGVGGWAVLGGGVRDRSYTGRFAGPRHGLLCRRAARAYRALPVAGLQRLHAANALTGVVRLVGDAPVQITAEDRDLPGVGTRRVVVFRLADRDATDGFVRPAEAGRTQSVFQEFAGPCAGRPESRTCGDPQPVEFVNNVGPDCDGVLTIEFKGCVVPAKLGDHAILLDAAMSLSRVCVPAYIPAPDGRLPGEYDPYTFIAPPTVPPVVPPTVVCCNETCPEGLAYQYEIPFAGGTGDYATLAGLVTVTRDPAQDTGNVGSGEYTCVWAAAAGDWTVRLTHRRLPGGSRDWKVWAETAGGAVIVGYAVDENVTDCCTPRQSWQEESNGAGDTPAPPLIGPVGDCGLCGPGDSIDVVGVLPHTECFFDATAADFSVKAGRWEFHASDSPAKGDYCVWTATSLDSVDEGPLAYTCTDPSVRSASVWDGFDLYTVRRRYVADVLLTPGPRANAHLVLNYRPHATAAGLFVYYIVELDYTAQAFRVARFNGVTAQTVLQQNVPGIKADEWYRLRADVEPGASAGTTKITAVLEGVTDPVTVSIGPLVVSGYYPSTGRSGVGADRAVSRFSFFRVEELP